MIERVAPMVLVSDALALEPRPGSLGCSPRAIHESVGKGGTLIAASEPNGEAAHIVAAQGERRVGFRVSQMLPWKPNAVLDRELPDRPNPRQFTFELVVSRVLTPEVVSILLSRGEHGGAKDLDCGLVAKTGTCHVAIVRGDNEPLPPVGGRQDAFLNKFPDECVGQDGALAPPLFLDFRGICVLVAHDRLLGEKSLPRLKIEIVLGVWDSPKVNAVLGGQFPDAQTQAGRHGSGPPGGIAEPSLNRGDWERFLSEKRENGHTFGVGFVQGCAERGPRNAVPILGKAVQSVQPIAVGAMGDVALMEPRVHRGAFHAK